MLKGVVALALAALIGVTAIAITAPAAWLAQHVAAASGNALTIAAARGSLASGSGALASADGRWRTPIAWRVVPARLLQGELAFELLPSPGLAEPRGTLVLSSQGLRFESLTAVVPAASIGMIAPRGRPVVTGGEVRVDLAELQASRDRATGTGTLRWERARLALPQGPVIALGEVAASFAPAREGIAGKLSNAAGDVRVAGTFALRGRELGIEASFTPHPGAPPELARALSALGPADAAGAIRFDWRGALR